MWFIIGKPIRLWILWMCQLQLCFLNFRYLLYISSYSHTNSKEEHEINICSFGFLTSCLPLGRGDWGKRDFNILFTPKFWLQDSLLFSLLSYHWFMLLRLSWLLGAVKFCCQFSLHFLIGPNSISLKGGVFIIFILNCFLIS